MSYEYKEIIKTYTEYIVDDYEVVDYIEANKELDYVYAQAAKADEYEKRAKAFDRVRKHYNDCCYTNEINGFPRIDETNFRKLCEVEFENVESGESNA